MTRLPGLGPKRARKLFDELGIDSLEALRAAAESEQLRGVRGFGPKFEEQVLAAFAAGIAEKPPPRVPAAQGAGHRRAGHRRRCARTRPPTASSSPAARGAWPTASRTSTSSPRRPTRRRSTARARRARRHRVRGSARRERRRAARTHIGPGGRPARRRARRSSATCSSTSPARATTTCSCARRRSAAGCTSPSTGSSTTRPARRRAARPRRRSTSGSAWRGSRPSCARAAASSRRRRTAASRGSSRTSDLRGDAALPHGRSRDGRNTLEEMAAAALERGYEYLAHHRPLGDARLRQPRHARRARARRSSASASSTTQLDGIELAHRDRDEHPPRRLARLRRRPARRARLGRRLGPHRVPDAARPR